MFTSYPMNRISTTSLRSFKLRLMGMSCEEDNKMLNLFNSNSMIAYYQDCATGAGELHHA
jgi:hypothetical protein